MAALVTAMVIFGTVGVVRKFIPLSSSQVAFFRGCIGAALLWGIATIQGKQLWTGLDKRSLWKLIITGALIGINWSLLFEAYRYTTVSVATLCYYMQPVILILLSVVFLSERMSLRKGLCIVFALIGMVLISGVLEPKEETNHSIMGILLALGAALLYAFVVLLNKTITGVDSYSKTIIQLGAASIVQIPYLVLTGEADVFELDITGIVLLLLISIVHTGIAYSLYFGSIEKIKTQTVALFSYLDPAVAVLCSAVFLQENMSVFGWIGAASIFGAILLAEAN